MTHPFSSMKYGIGHKVPRHHLGGMAGPGEVVSRVIREDRHGNVHYEYGVESRVWPGDPLRHQWMSEETLDKYEALRPRKVQHAEEVA